MKTREWSMLKTLCCSAVMVAGFALLARAEGETKLTGQTEPKETVQETVKEEPKEEKPKWMGKYCMSMFTRARTAKTVGKGRLSLALKFQYNDYDKVMDSSGCYCSLGDDSKCTYNMVTTAKYGWAKDHHLALGVPVLCNNAETSGNTLNTCGLGNIYVFEKWNMIHETDIIPAVAFDVWHFFPTGNSTRKVGTDDYAWRFTSEISKSFDGFSVHLNPGYQISEGCDNDVIIADAAVLFRPWKTLWPAVEYNYTYKECKGRSNDLIPGIIWKFYPGASFKIGAVINLDTTLKYKDDVGLVMKLFYKF